MIKPPLSPTRISLKILNLRFNLGHEGITHIPLRLLTSNSLKNLDLRFSLDMERWLTPPIVTNQNLTENFKFKI